MPEGRFTILEKLVSENNLAWLLLVISVLIASGLVFILAERPPFSLGTYIIYPGTASQTTGEFLTIFFLYSLSIAGLILLYEAPRYRSRPNLAIMFLISGILVVLISVLLLFTVYGMK
ncbi:MAG: hypothetical protein ACP5II_04990 [Infirmifilum sp.]|jgi:hypothetical protein|uniref:hypothetical protein n=1 Tax=Infirmifilum TaxID=2856573 RepID=UPI002353E8C0